MSRSGTVGAPLDTYINELIWRWQRLGVHAFARGNGKTKLIKDFPVMLGALGGFKHGLIEAGGVVHRQSQESQIIVIVL